PDQSGSKPFDAPNFRATGRPREDRLVRGRAFRGDLRTLPQVAPKDIERPEFEEPPFHPLVYPGAPAGTQSPSPAVTVPPAPADPAPAPSLTFDGLGRPPGNGFPPDTNGDVGPTYYIQTINTSIGIFRKSDGFLVTSFSFNSFFAGHFGNLCDTNNFG